MKQLFVSVLVCLSLIVLSACEEEGEQVAVSQIKAVKTLVVGSADGAPTRKLSGVVQTAIESKLSFRVSGRVAKINVDRGDAVKRGDTLAVLDQTDLALGVNTAKAKLQTARSELNTARQQNTRQQNLLKQNFVSRAAAEQALEAFQTAQSTIAIAESDLQTAQDNLERTVLKAPFDGEIATREIEAFREINAGETAFLLQGADGLEIDILVPETIIREIEQGAAALATFPALPNVSIAATVTQIGVRSESGNAFPVTLKLAGSKADVRAGMTAEVAIAVDTRESDASFLLPTSAVDLRFFETADGDEANYVFVVGEDSKLSLRLIEIIGVRGNEIEVTTGLTSGDRVVVAGVSFLSEGQEVKLWEPQYTIPATLGK